MKRLIPFFLVALALTGCQEEQAEDTTPVEITAETLGHYCQMNLAEHDGPKAQVHLKGLPGKPLFFSQVRDAIAYQRLPEQSHEILAIQVQDMGAPGATWENPGKGNWIAAEDAYYVVGSRREGGMGAPETVPFGTQPAALAFAAAEGGQVLRLDQIQDDMVLTPVDAAHDAGHEDDADYMERLRSLTREAGG